MNNNNLVQSYEKVFLFIFVIYCVWNHFFTHERWFPILDSFNLAIHPDTPAKDINKLYITAWELGIKSLYYQISENSAQSFSRDVLNCVACE